MVNNGRAAQFAPFEQLDTSRLSEGHEEMAKINAVLTAIKKGDMLRIVYYDTDSYRTIVGICRSIDLINRTLTVLDTLIPTDDIIYAEIE